MTKYAKIKKTTKAKKFADGGYADPIMTGVGIASGFGAKKIREGARNSDGSYNEDKMGAAGALESGAAGAAIGTKIVPGVGTGIGAGVGALYGFLNAQNETIKMNKQIDNNNVINLKNKASENLAKEEEERNNKNLYNQAYNSMYSTTGNVNSSLYAKGGVLPKIDSTKYPILNQPMTSARANTYDVLSDGQNGLPAHDSMVNSLGYSFIGGTGNGRMYKTKDNHYLVAHPSGKGFVDIGDINNESKTISTETINPIKDNTPNPLDKSGRHVTQFGESYDTYKYDDGTTKMLDKSGKEVLPIKALGGKVVPGGELNKLASDTVKAEGNTHAEGGIKLQTNGKPYAEVEDQEIIQGNNVFSDRITFDDGETVAQKAEKFAKIKGKNERKINSSDYREANGAKRNTEFADKKLDQLFQIQEASKDPVNNGQKFADGGDIMKSAQMAVPYIDNIYNAKLINETPDIPIPTEKKAYYATAMPMKTNYDVDTNIKDINNSLSSFNKNIDENTSSSNIARGNKLAAFAESLNNKSSIYQNKTNVETQLNNQNSMNIQSVNNMNVKNKQDIDNLNLSQKDQYNYSKMMRQDDILRRKSANVSNAVGDAQGQIQDYNAGKLDQEKMILDAEKYPDGSGYARLIGTPTGDNLMKNPTNYKKAEQALIKGKQEKALQDFYTRYGKK